MEILDAVNIKLNVDKELERQKKNGCILDYLTEANYDGEVFTMGIFVKPKKSLENISINFDVVRDNN